MTCKYNKSLWMEENLNQIANNFRKGEECNYETFLDPMLIKE